MRARSDGGQRRVGLLRQLDQHAVVAARLVAVAGGLGRLGRAGEPAQPVRLALLRLLELLQRLGRLLHRQQHLAEQLARRQDTARRDDVLLVAVLEVGGRAHQSAVPRRGRRLACAIQASTARRWISTSVAQ